MTALELRLWVGALVCWAATLGLGYRVMHGAPTFADMLAPWILGRATAVALAFTAMGYALCLTLVACGLALASALRGRPLTPVVALVVLQLTSQGAGSLLKLVFHRVRPDRWLGREEVGFSYPSGHATTAFAFYGALFVAVALSAAPPPLRVAGMLLLAIVIAGICWSRVALGAHYPTDVIGGALLGIGFLCAALAIAERIRPGVLAG